MHEVTYARTGRASRNERLVAAFAQVCRRGVIAPTDWHDGFRLPFARFPLSADTQQFARGGKQCPSPRSIVRALRLASVMFCTLLLACACGQGQQQAGAPAAGVQSSMTAAEEVKQEALAPNGETDHPLPVAASWATGTPWDAAGTYASGAPPNQQYTPDWQMQQLEAGHHLLPSFAMPDPSMDLSTWLAHYQVPLKTAAALGLPIVFVGTQIEQDLYTDPQYLNLPYPQNPNVWTNGAAQPKLSPFGPIPYWEQVGAKYAVGAIMAQLQQWYPNPPKVVFLLNNEAHKLQWSEAETDQHYLDLYGTGQTGDFKREAFATAWTARYKAMFNALKNALASSNWRTVSVFYGYGAMGARNFSGGASWKTWSLYYPNNVAPETYPWDGGSAEYYMWDSGGDPTAGDGDFVAGGPQVMSMNWPFMFPEIYAHSPNFWFELSVWNGINVPLSSPGNYQNRLAAIGQTYTPARYGGYVQWGIWLLRPRAVRDFHGWSEDRIYNQSYFDEVVASVDRIYANATLTSFWRKGQLVPNTARQHPFSVDIPPEYASANRMFMLSTNLDPAWPWVASTDIPVFSLALTQGTAPNRQWLVYAFSPEADRPSVQVTIPNYKMIVVEATIKGSFYLVDEASNKVSPVD
jgi:hypothetical protein